MNTEDVTRLIHPALAVAVIFPLIGIVVHYAWQTRQRRLQAQETGKSKIPAAVGPEHLRLGRWLSNGVVVLSLIGLAHPLFTKMARNQVWTQDSFRAWFVVLMFGVTLASLVLLNRAGTRLWRGVFATLTGMGLVILGSQPEIFRRGFEWYVSHYYYGMTATMLMIFSLAIYPDIYKDRSQRWRTVHVVLNCIALLFFVGQAMTGARDLLEIPLSWQESHIYKCDFTNLTCPP
ncbi:MAG: DUF4079 domain-containing protein [Synechococcales cyanobacterium M58_A2018_015]|nr:DUF4079 domain-containing protein [Synechococcales cyanobacterium M58_A2018_015]